MADDFFDEEVQDSDEVMDIYCDLCKEHGVQNVQVESFCLDCEQYFCSTCLKYHQKFVQTHKQLDKQDMPKDICQDFCDKHKEEFIKFYCKDCNDFVCLKCKTGNHTNCRNVQFLPLLVKNLENTEEFSTFENRLKQYEAALSDTKKLHNQKQKSIEHYKMEASAAMNFQKQQLLEDYGIATNKFERTIEQIYTSDKEKYDSAKKQMNDVADEFYLLWNDIINQKKCKQRCKLFMKMKKTVSVIDNLDEKLASSKKDSALTVTVYKYNPEISVLKNLYVPVGKMEINGETYISDNCEGFSIEEKFRLLEQKNRAFEKFLKEVEELPKIQNYKGKTLIRKTNLKSTPDSNKGPASRESIQRSLEIERKSIEVDRKYLNAELKAREAEVKLRQATQSLLEAEEKSRKADEKLRQAKQQSIETEQKSREADVKLRQATQQSLNAEEKSRDADNKLGQAFQQSLEAEQKVSSADAKLKQAMRVSLEADEKARDAEHRERQAYQECKEAEQKIRQADQQFRDAEREAKQFREKRTELDVALHRIRFFGVLAIMIIIIVPLMSIIL